MDTFLTVKDCATAIFKDKGSKFIAFIYPVSSVDEIKNLNNLSSNLLSIGQILVIE